MTVATFHKRLRRLKDKNKLASIDIAKACGVSRAVVTTWLNDKVPSPKNVTKLAQFFNVSVDYLLHGYSLEGRQVVMRDIEQLIPLLSTSQLKIIVELMHELAIKTSQY